MEVEEQAAAPSEQPAQDAEHHGSQLQHQQHQQHEEDEARGAGVEEEAATAPPAREQRHQQSLEQVYASIMQSKVRNRRQHSSRRARGMARALDVPLPCSPVVGDTCLPNNAQAQQQQQQQQQQDAAVPLGASSTVVQLLPGLSGAAATQRSGGMQWQLSGLPNGNLITVVNGGALLAPPPGSMALSEPLLPWASIAANDAAQVSTTRPLPQCPPDRWIAQQAVLY